MSSVLFVRRDICRINRVRLRYCFERQEVSESLIGAGMISPSISYESQIKHTGKVDASDHQTSSVIKIKRIKRYEAKYKCNNLMRCNLSCMIFLSNFIISKRRFV